MAGPFSNNFTPAAPASVQPAPAPAQVANATLNNPNGPANAYGSAGAYPANMSSGSNAPGATSNTAPATPVNPLDEFAKAFEAPRSNAAGPEPLFPVNSEQLAKTIQGLDFTSTLAPDTITKILAGDAAALAESLNAVGRAAFGYNLNTTMKLVEQGIEKKLGQFKQEVPGMIDVATSKSVVAEDPRLSHPALAPMKAAVEQMLTAQFPQASASQRKEYLNKYLLGVVQQLGGAAPRSNSPQPDPNALPSSSDAENFWDAFERTLNN